MQRFFEPPHEPGWANVAPEQRLRAHCRWPSSEVARAATAKRVMRVPLSGIADNNHQLTDCHGTRVPYPRVNIERITGHLNT